MENFGDFWNKNKGIIIGVIIAILLLITGLHDLIVAILLIGVCAYGGNYIYHNKNDVKQKLKKFIDKL